jgi:ligand-binding sensor domain-containing protein
MSDEEDYDVVVDVLQKHRATLWKMTQQNMNAESFNMMDEIRLEQIDEIDRAINMWKNRKTS